MTTVKKKLTQTACDKASPNAKIWDTEVKWFGMFTGKSSKTFYYQYDVRGRTQRAKLGNFPQVSAGIARGDALQLAADHASGISADLARIAVWYIKGKKGGLLLDPADDNQRFAKVRLPMPWRMAQGDKHLP